jgi:hypothetical protein
MRLGYELFWGILYSPLVISPLIFLFFKRRSNAGIGFLIGLAFIILITFALLVNVQIVKNDCIRNARLTDLTEALVQFHCGEGTALITLAVFISFPVDIVVFIVVVLAINWIYNIISKQSEQQHKVD